MNCNFAFKDNYKFEDLVDIVSVLRSENGCDWDKEQTHKSIRKGFIEEVYEAVEAIDTENPELLCEELGDVLLQVVFHARISAEDKEFDIDDVCDGICKKLIYRHPHVFGDVKVKNSAEILENWDALKKTEKHQTTAADELDAVARSLPSLMRTQKVIKRARKAGIMDKNPEAAIDGIKSAAASLENSGDRKKALEDLLFYTCAVLQSEGLDGEELLYSRCEEIINAEKQKN